MKIHHAFIWSAHIGEYNASHYWIFFQNKEPIWKILRTDKNNNFKFTIKFLMTLDRSYIGYLSFLGIDLFKSVLMYSNGDICLIKLLFDLGLFTVQIYRCMMRAWQGGLEMHNTLDDRRKNMYSYDKAVLRSSKYFFRLRFHGAVNPNYGFSSYKHFCGLWMSFFITDTLKITYFDLSTFWRGLMKPWFCSMKFLQAFDLIVRISSRSRTS